MKPSAQTTKNIIAVTATLGLLVGLGSAFLLSNAGAQESPRILTIVPPSKEYTEIKPGDKEEGELKLINDSDQSMTFTASTQDFIVEDTHGTPSILPAGTLGKRFSAAAWIGIVPNTFTIAAHDKATLHYFIQVPPDARPGGHYAAVVYSPTEAIGVNGTGASVQTQLGTLFSLDIAGPITEEAVVTRFTTDRFQEYGPVHFFTQIKNYSDIHIKPKGTIVVKNVFGKQVATIPFDEHNIFPTAARDYVSVFDKKWMIGKYTAQLLLSYGKNNNLPLLATISFIVFPWKVALLIILILVAILLGWLVWKRRKEIEAWEEHMRTHHSEE